MCISSFFYYSITSIIYTLGKRLGSNSVVPLSTERYSGIRAAILYINEFAHCVFSFSLRKSIRLFGHITEVYEYITNADETISKGTKRKTDVDNLGCTHSHFCMNVRRFWSSMRNEPNQTVQNKEIKKGREEETDER